MTTPKTISNDQALKAARYSFLERPPTHNNKRNAKAPPSPPTTIALPLSAPPKSPNPPLHRRTSNISAWAARVQPGSPTPRSPCRRPSNSNIRRPSLTRLGMRSGISHSRVPSANFNGLISAQDVDVNLSALGYTSVFIHVPPKTPSTPSHLAKTPATASSVTVPVQPSSPKASRTTRATRGFRSLRPFRLRSKSTPRPAALPSPTKNTPTNIRARADLIIKSKKASYAHVRPPPPLSNNIALMQFVEGGTVESNVRRAMEEQSRATGGILGVADVYRDGTGGLWLDQEEEMEYAPLLGGEISGRTGESQWIKFGNDKNEDDVSPKTGLMDLVDSKRGSVSTQDSDLDLKYLVTPADETRCGPDNIILSLAPKSPFRKTSPIAPGLSILSLPARPRRTAKHLRKPELLVDLGAFGPRSPGFQVRISPKSPLFPSSPRTTSASHLPHPRTPRSARFSSAFAAPPSNVATGASQRGRKVRRRPAPLKLVGAAPNAGWKKTEVSPLPSVAVIAETRREFVEASFAPKPVFYRVGKASKSAANINSRATTNANTAVPVAAKADQGKLQRGKIIFASLDPVGDLKYEMGALNLDTSANNLTMARRKPMGLKGLFSRR